MPVTGDFRSARSLGPERREQRPGVDLEVPFRVFRNIIRRLAVRDFVAFPEQQSAGLARRSVSRCALDYLDNTP
jgi:hypothetical protein